MILIYDQTGVPGALSDLIASIDGRVFLRSAAHYKGPESGADIVYTDSPEIAADYAARDVDVYDLSGEPVAGEGDTAAPDSYVTEKGGGWFEIVVDGGVVDKKQGREAAEKRLAELTTDE